MITGLLKELIIMLINTFRAEQLNSRNIIPTIDIPDQYKSNYMRYIYMQYTISTVKE